MSEPAVKYSGACVQVPVDAQGRPQCLCGWCSGVMAEVAPNQWRCEHAVAIDSELRATAAKIAEGMEAL